MTGPLQESQLKRNNILEKIKVEGDVGKEQKVIVRYKTVILTWKGFESQKVIWNKIYERL